MTVEIGQVAGLAEMLDSERLHPLAAHPAEPAERRRMPVDQGDQRRVRRQIHEQPLDMGRAALPSGLVPTPVDALAPALGGVPAGVQAVGRGHGEEAGAGNLLADRVMGCERLGCQGTGGDNGQK